MKKCNESHSLIIAYQTPRVYTTSESTENILNEDGVSEGFRLAEFILSFKTFMRAETVLMQISAGIQNRCVRT